MKEHLVQKRTSKDDITSNHPAGLQRNRLSPDGMSGPDHQQSACFQEEDRHFDLLTFLFASANAPPGRRADRSQPGVPSRTLIPSRPGAAFVLDNSRAFPYDIFQQNHHIQPGAER